MSINLVANAIIWGGSMWAVLTQRVRNRAGGAIVVLLLVNFAALGNTISPWTCHSEPEVGLNTAVALGVLWGIWRLELQHLVKRRLACAFSILACGWLSWWSLARLAVPATLRAD
ncbi:hypothetical protein [Cupriavidus necator]|uniref:hypothetical protein n=1 Tax=Cupriavidus necator TaxID=106590 RepID=UPI001F34E81F|nr:hypothetical protein [Cupriavidus necator]